MITNQTVRAVDSGNGVTTSFNYGFLIPETSSMVLTYIDSLGNETTVSTAGLTISGIGTTSGGSVGYAPGGTPIDTGSLFVIERASPYTQEASYTNQDGYYPATTEEALDWLAYQTQQLKDKVSRALMVSVGNQLALNTLPIESARAGYVVGFDDDGQVSLVDPASGSPVTSYWAGVLQTTNSSTAQTALGATTVGAAVFTATTATAARSAISAPLGDSVMYGNRLVNGEFRFWQRGTSLASQADDSYGAMGDRWYILTQTGTIAGARQSNPFDGARYSGQLTQSQASAQRIGVAQIIEGKNCIDLRGQAVTFYGRFKSSSGGNIRVAILEWTGTEDTVTSDFVNDWTSSTYTAGNFFTTTSTTVTAVKQYASPGTGWVDFFVTGTLGSSLTNICVMLWSEGTEAQNVTLSLANCGLIPGTTAPVRHTPRPYSLEYLLCCRYYFKTFDIDTTPAQNAGRSNAACGVQAGGASAAQHALQVRYAVSMRATPTVTAFNPSATNALIRNVSGNTNWATTTESSDAGPDGTAFFGQSAGGSAAGQECALHITASAEL